MGGSKSGCKHKREDLSRGGQHMWRKGLIALAAAVALGGAVVPTESMAQKGGHGAGFAGRGGGAGFAGHGFAGRGGFAGHQGFAGRGFVGRGGFAGHRFVGRGFRGYGYGFYPYYGFYGGYAYDPCWRVRRVWTP